LQHCTRAIRVTAGILALSAGVLAALRISGPGTVADPEALADAALLADSSALPRDDELALLSLPVTGDEELVFRPVIVTGYASRIAETDSTPALTASMTHVRPGCLALSRDLLRTFTPGAPFDFGDGVVIPGVGIFTVEDTMHPRWTNRADIWFADPRHAIRWGRRKALIARLPAPVEEASPLFALGPRVRDLTRITQQ
jgi:3D (Asp-Asp-Asp) domain-containing protein